MRCVQKTDMLTDYLLPMIEKLPVDRLTESESEVRSRNGRLCFSTACSCGPGNPGI